MGSGNDLVPCCASNLIVCNNEPPNTINLQTLPVQIEKQIQNGRDAIVQKQLIQLLKIASKLLMHIGIKDAGVAQKGAGD